VLHTFFGKNFARCWDAYCICDAVANTAHSGHSPLPISLSYPHAATVYWVDINL